MAFHDSTNTSLQDKGTDLFDRLYPAPALQDQAKLCTDLINSIPLAFVDLETTGANARSDKITEVGIVTVRGSLVEQWSTLVNPGVPISPFIESLTGINNQMVRDAPSFGEIHSEVVERLNGCVFVAHNARFDHGFLQAALEPFGRELKAPIICTVALSRHLFPDESKHNLDIQVSRHGLHVSGRHRALADADLARQLWERLRARHAESEFGDAIARQLFKRKTRKPAKAR